MSKQPINNRKSYEKNYSKEFKNFLTIVESQAYDDNMFDITPEYLILFALDYKDSMLYKCLSDAIPDGEKGIRQIYDESYEKIMLPTKQKTALNKDMKTSFSSETISLFKKADEERKKQKNKYITTDHLLCAYLLGNGILVSIFHKHDVDYSTYTTALANLHTLTDILGIIDSSTKKTVSLIDDEFPLIYSIEMNGTPITEGSAKNMLDAFNNLQGKTMISKNDSKKEKDEIDYCTNLNKLAKGNQIDNIVGREKEIRDIIQILNRRKSNNVIIVGDAGVGKTAIVEGLAKKIVNNEVPALMNNKIIFKLSFSSMTAGTQFRGMMEERVKNLMDKLKKMQNAILFIDDIQSLPKSDRDGGESTSVNLLADILSDSNVQIIVTTNYSGYRSIFENNNSFSSKFQKINLEKPSKEECINIIQQTLPAYEKYHEVKYDAHIPELCVLLADRYITERTLPTSALDLIDEVGSYKRLGLNSFNELNGKREKKTSLLKEKDLLIKEDKIDESKKINEEISNLEKEIAHLLAEHDDKKNNIVSSDDVYKILSEKTGIPINKLSVAERKGLKNIEEVLKKDIIGQDEAIEIISRAIKRNRVGLSSPNKPILTCMCIGKSGCGKTLLAKKIAAEVFGDEKYLVRFDMSEYADKTSVNKLIGSSAGYVGYENGGLLTEAIKKRKYAVLLIDEIEKANEDVFNLFLQVLDEGFLSDNNGRKVDFKNTIIILTSNVGTKRASADHGLGFDNSENDNYKQIVEKELKNKFPPEFINRLDEVVYFNTLTDDNLKNIIKLEISKLNKKLNDNKQSLVYTDTVIDYLLKIVTKEKDYGARPIIRAIQNEMENKIIDLLMENEYNDYTFSFDVENDKIVVK